jgi:prepilin-type N-terminal cleavage/methylation domain-containing protein
MEMKTNWRDGLSPVPKIMVPIRAAHAPSRAGFGASPKPSHRNKSVIAGARSPARQELAFTLIELLVVIVIIAILMGLAFPVFQSIQNQAKKTQAKNDLTQIVTAVNAFYTEYGKYPLSPATPGDTSYGGATSNGTLFNELRNITPTENPRGIVFLSPPDAKDQTNARNGLKTSDGQYYDPWGKPYLVRVDTNYDNFVTNPYSANAGTTKDPSGTLAVQAGVIAWSVGKNQIGGTGDKNSADSNDDVISWQ